MPGPSDSVPRLRHSTRNRRAAICAALLVVCGFGDARAEIRIWVDASGVTHFSDDPERAPDASTSLEGEGAFGKIPRSELHPGPIKSFEGRKFCGSLSGNSMYAAAKLGMGNMILMLPQRGKEVPPDKFTEV